MTDPGASAKVLIDGIPRTQISFDNRGLQYADGLFETLAVVDGRPCLWDRHLRRLQAGAERLGIACPDTELLGAEAQALTADCRCGVLKVLLTRGGGGRGYRAPAGVPPMRILALSDWPVQPADWTAQGVSVCVCCTPIGHSPALAGLKHLGRLEQVLARSEWSDPAIAEGLMCDPDGYVVEGTQMNLLIENGEGLLTPALDRAGIAGVVRGLVMDLARAQGQPVQEGRLTLSDLRDADALYLTNSIVGMWRVRRLDDHDFDLDRPVHPVLRQAMEQVYRP